MRSSAAIVATQRDVMRESAKLFTPSASLGRLGSEAKLGRAAAFAREMEHKRQCV